MARVIALASDTTDTVHVLAGSTGEVIEQSQDGLKTTVRWDWALQADHTRDGKFRPVEYLEAAVSSSVVGAAS